MLLFFGIGDFELLRQWNIEYVYCEILFEFVMEKIMCDGKNKLTKDELHRLHEIYIDFIVYFQKICDENGLMFYLCGGGCIGAIRHNGFIPWDDDIDIFMPRPEYEKLKVVWREKADNNRYPICFPSKMFNNHNQFITIADANTTYIRPYQRDIDMPHGLVLDIFPLDGYPSSSWKRKVQIFWALIYLLYCTQLIPKNNGFIKKIVSATLLKIVPKKFYYSIWSYAEKQMSKHDFYKSEYVTEICAGPYYLKNKYPQLAFRKAILKDFEGLKLPVPVGYDEYLRIAFGDYMTMPPKEKQVGHHEALFMDLENPYIKYKGKYYCKDK